MSREFSEKRFYTLASHGLVDTRVELCLCRDREDAVGLLPPESVVVIGAHRSFWPRRENALARKLHQKGHHVIFSYLEPKNA
jgi:hypothetical protein